MGLTNKEMLESADFKRLVSKRWTVSLILLAGVFVTYYGYIMLIAYNLALVGRDAVKAALVQFRQQCDAEKRLLEERWKSAASAVPRPQLAENGAGEKLLGVRTSYELALMERDARIAWCESVVSRAERAVFAQGETHMS